MRVVTFSTANGSEVHPEVEADELLILAVVTTQAECAGLRDELRRILALVRFVASVATEGEGGVRVVAGAFLLDVVMTRETAVAS